MTAKPLTEKQIKNFQKRAKYVAIRRGYPELADDFAGQIFVYFFEKTDRGATVDQLFIDFLRKTYGRPGTPGGDTRVNAEHNAIRLDQEDETGSLPHEYIGCAERDPEPQFRDGDFAHCFRGREAEIYERYFVNNEAEQAIAESFGVSPSRVSQMIGRMRERIRGEAIFQEGRERLEWDEYFLQFSIEWAVI